MEKKYTYAEGLYFNPINPKVSDEIKKWKKGSITISKDKFIKQLNSLQADEKGYIRFDLIRNEKEKDVFYSFRLNDWKPEPRDVVDPIQPEDVPF